MAINALFITTLLFMALGIIVLQECQFLIPYRGLIFGRYGSAIGVFVAALFVNVFAGIYWLSRKVFLKDTGRKLAHLEKQLHTQAGISEELAERLRD